MKSNQALSLSVILGLALFASGASAPTNTVPTVKSGAQSSSNSNNSKKDDTDSGPSDSAEVQTFNTDVPSPTFAAKGSENFGSIFVSCKGLGGSGGGAAGAIGAALQGMAGALSSGGDMSSMLGAMPVSMDSECQAAGDAGIDSGATSCENFQGPDGRFDPSQVAALRAKAMKAIGALQCKRSKLQAIRSEVDCLSTQANLLTQQVATLQKAYVDNIQRFQQDVGKLKSIISDRETQQKDVLTKLNGDPDSKATGLIDMKARTEALIAAMPTEIDGVKKLQDEAKQQRKALEEQVQFRIAGLTGECFKNRPSPSYLCDVNGAPVSAYDHVLCRYEQNMTLDQNGRIDRDDRTARRAHQSRLGLQSLLDQILGDIPSSKLPSKPEEAVTQNIQVLTPDEVESRYGAKLRTFSAKGMNVYSFIMNKFTNCYSDANSQVSRERKLANTLIGLSQFKLKEAEKAINTQVNTLLNKYSQHWADALRALTGQHVPLDVSQCQTAEPEQQAGCLDDIRKNMEGLLSGTVKQAQMRLFVPGNSVPPIMVQCMGINGCVAALQNVSRNLKAEVAKVKAFKNQYVQQANQAVEGFTSRMSQIFSPASQRLTDMVKKLNSAMASAGIGSGLNFPPIEAEELEKEQEKEGEEGLYKVPKDVLKLIGGKTKPPMLNISGDSFQSALSGLAQGIKEADQEMSKVSDSVSKLGSIESKCRAAEMKKLAQDLRAEIDRLRGAGCQAEAYCGDPDAYEELMHSLSGIGNFGLSDVSSGNLKNGLSRVCPSRATVGELSGASLTDIRNKVNKKLDDKKIICTETYNATIAPLHGADPVTDSARASAAAARATCNHAADEWAEKFGEEITEKETLVVPECRSIFSDIQEKASEVQSSGRRESTADSPH